MDKAAQTQYPIHDLLRQRWSPLAFSDWMVELEKLRSALEAARWAAFLTTSRLEVLLLQLQKIKLNLNLSVYSVV